MYEDDDPYSRIDDPYRPEDDWTDEDQPDEEYEQSGNEDGRLNSEETGYDFNLNDFTDDPDEFEATEDERLRAAFLEESIHTSDSEDEKGKQDQALPDDENESQLTETDKLKPDLKRNALLRLENAARTKEDFWKLIEDWDRLDRNRERRERYHEILRSGDDLPLDYGAREDGLIFPRHLGNVLSRQRRKGDFIDTIFFCPHEIDEMMTDEYLSQSLKGLSPLQKELIFLSAIRGLNSDKIGKLRSQSGRNIRKVKKTLLKKIRKKILPTLKERMENNLPMTKKERLFLKKYGDLLEG